MSRSTWHKQGCLAKPSLYRIGGNYFPRKLINSGMYHRLYGGRKSLHRIWYRKGKVMCPWLVDEWRAKAGDRVS